MSLRVLLIVGPNQLGHQCEDFVKRVGVSYDRVGSLEQFSTVGTRGQYNGIVFDDALARSGTHQQRELVRAALEIFPALRLRQPSDLQGLGYFLSQSCTAFPARAMRSTERYKINFNILLSTDLGWSPTKVEPTVTSDVSEGGCFISFAREWKLGNEVWFTVYELGDNKPIRAEIRWQAPWGKAMRYPGLGVRFTQIDPEQAKALVEISRRHLQIAGPDSAPAR